MFIPDYVESGFNHATLNGKPIVKKTISVYESEPEPESFSILHPWIVFGSFLLITLALSYLDWKKKKLSKWFDVIVFSLVGWLGLLLFILWIATDHRAAANNFNLLWAFPLHAVTATMLYREKFYSLLKTYFAVTGIVLAATLVFWMLLPQQLNMFLIPVVIALAVRAWTIWKLL